MMSLQLHLTVFMPINSKIVMTATDNGANIADVFKGFACDSEDNSAASTEMESDDNDCAI